MFLAGDPQGDDLVRASTRSISIRGDPSKDRKGSATVPTHAVGRPDERTSACSGSALQTGCSGLGQLRSNSACPLSAQVGRSRPSCRRSNADVRPGAAVAAQMTAKGVTIGRLSSRRRRLRCRAHCSSKSWPPSRRSGCCCIPDVEDWHQIGPVWQAAGDVRPRCRLTRPDSRSHSGRRPIGKAAGVKSLQNAHIGCYPALAAPALAVHWRTSASRR